MILDDTDSSDEEVEPAPVGDLKDDRFKPILYFFVFLLHWKAAFNISAAAIGSILRFFKFFIGAIAAAYSNEELALQRDRVPLTLKTIHKHLKFDDPSKLYTKYAVCTKCSTVYEVGQCLLRKANGYQAKTCSYVRYPCHPQLSRRTECGGNILNAIITKKGLIHRPICVYPYQPLSTALSRLAATPGFLECCEQWRNRPLFSEYGYLCDIYDGAIWREFVDNGFLKAPYNYLLTLNVDWFSPYARSIYSLGAIYLTTQNLPRALRNRPENILLVGLIPGPSEPKLTINSYLGPLLLELKEAWAKGIAVSTPNGTKVTLRVAVTCVACDIPATKKVLGFVGIRAVLACNKCLKPFEHVRDEVSNWTNYSGFDRSQWPSREDEIFVSKCTTMLTKERCNTQAATKSLESEIGGRYSALMDLAYFKPVRFSAIDPMHNLFLGTGKHMMEVWLTSETLSTVALSGIEEKCRAYVVPDGVGRLPTNISSKFGGFTADQWRNWITIFSPVLLKGCIDDLHWRCWMLFVSACTTAVSRSIRISSIEEADRRLLAFCQQFCALYGEKSCTMNMHLHLHLAQCIKDYGSTSGFWLYTFERYNGMLGSYHTNNKCIESQIMKTFLQHQSLNCNLALDSCLNDNNFKATLPSKGNTYVKTYYERFQDNVVALLELPLGEIAISPNLYCAFRSGLTPIGPFKEKIFSSSEYVSVCTIVEMLFGPDVQVQRYFLQFGRINISDTLIGSCLPRSSRNSSIIQAHWPVEEAQGLNPRPVKTIGQIQYFVKTNITVATSSTTSISLELILAYVHWFKKHRHENWYGLSFKVCDPIAPRIVNTYSFLPIQRITGRCAHVTLKVDFGDMVEDVFIACHLPLQFSY